MSTRREVLLGAAGVALASAAPPKRELRSLRAAIRGEVLAPGDRGYDAARRLYDKRFDGIRPPAVARPRDAADVRALVRWAADHDARLVPRSGGHAYNGASTSRQAFVVDMRHLDGVRSGRVARVGPAARNIDVYAALARQGRGWASGSCPTVGAGGLALGGGMGLAGRRHGLTCDTLVAIDVVTADGHLRRVSADNRPDLFWALRGGGGNFGIVTALHLRTFAARRAAWFFASYPRSSAAEALAAWDDLAPGAPPELTSIFTLPAGTGRVTALGQYLGPERALRRLVAPLERVPSATLTAGTSDYLALQRRWAGCADGGLATCWRSTRSSFAAASVYVSRRLSPAGRRAFVDASEHATLILDAYGGAINDLGPDATAFVHRDARFSVQILAYDPIARAAPAVRRAHAAVAPHGNGQAYQNYADPSLRDAQRAWYGSNLKRLVAVKREVDPDERFRLRQGIPG